MDTINMRTVRRQIIIWTTATLMVAGLSINVDAQVADTCKNVPGFTTNLEADTSGVWGSVDFDNTEDTLTLTVADGYEVRLCVKAGSGQQGDGPEITDWFTEGVHVVAHSTGKELSHYAVDFRQAPPDDDTTTTTTTTIGTTTTVEEPTTTTQPETTTTVPSETTTTVEAPSTTDQTSSTSITAPSTTQPLEELPFTGFDGEDLAKLAASVFSAGALIVLFGRMFRREDA